MTKDNVKDTVVKDGFITADELCTSAYARPAKIAGISAGGGEPTPMSSDGALLELEGVSKRFGPVQALDRVDFAVHGGEVVGLVGDNGAGKSTLVKAIAGIHSRRRRRDALRGQRGQGHGPQGRHRLGIATVYQDLALCDNLDVVANVFLGQEELSAGPAGPTRQLDEAKMEHRAGELLSNALGDDPQPAQRGRHPLRAGSASRSPSRARCSASRTSSCSTSRRRRWACRRPSRCSS